MPTSTDTIEEPVVFLNETYMVTFWQDYFWERNFGRRVYGANVKKVPSPQ